MSRAAGILILTKVRTNPWPENARGTSRRGPNRRRLPGRLLRATLAALTWPVRWIGGTGI
jgi:hypothetical protein